MPQYMQQVKRLHYILPAITPEHAKACIKAHVPAPSFEEAVLIFFETDEPVESEGYELAAFSALAKQYPTWGRQWTELSPNHSVAEPYLTRTFLRLI